VAKIRAPLRADVACAPAALAPEPPEPEPHALTAVTSATATTGETRHLSLIIRVHDATCGGRTPPADPACRRSWRLVPFRAMADIAVTGSALIGEETASGAAARADFEVVPRRGLPVVAVVLALLIAAIAVDTLWPLEFLHLAGGAGWTIVDLFMGLIIGPVLGRLSIPARVELTKRLMPKMVLLMPVLVTMTLAAGWQLGVHMGTVQSAYLHHDLIVASYIVVGVMAVIALGLLEPANIAVLIELRKPAPRPRVIEHLMKRFIVCSGITGLMQVATLVLMTKIAAG
jgi:hypothetical protein